MEGVALRPYLSSEILIDLLFDSRTVFAVLGLVCIASLVLIFILLHHWRAYTIRREPLRRVATIYLIGNCILGAGTIIFGIIGLTS